eukprot:gene871-1193_t
MDVDETRNFAIEIQGRTHSDVVFTSLLTRDTLREKLHPFIKQLRDIQAEDGTKYYVAQTKRGTFLVDRTHCFDYDGYDPNIQRQAYYYVCEDDELWSNPVGTKQLMGISSAHNGQVDEHNACLVIIHSTDPSVIEGTKGYVRTVAQLSPSKTLIETESAMHALSLHLQLEPCPLPDGKYVTYNLYADPGVSSNAIEDPSLLLNFPEFKHMPKSARGVMLQKYHCVGCVPEYEDFNTFNINDPTVKIVFTKLAATWDIMMAGKISVGQGSEEAVIATVIDPDTYEGSFTGKVDLSFSVEGWIPKHYALTALPNFGKALSAHINLDTKDTQALTYRVIAFTRKDGALIRIALTNTKQMLDAVRLSNSSKPGNKDALVLKDEDGRPLTVMRLRTSARSFLGQSDVRDPKHLEYVEQAIKQGVTYAVASGKPEQPAKKLKSSSGVEETQKV